MIPLTDEVETDRGPAARAESRCRASCTRTRDPRRRQGPARADDAPGRVRGLPPRARAPLAGARRRSRSSDSTWGRAGSSCSPGGRTLVAKWDRALSSPTTRKIYVAAVRGVTPSKGAVTRDLREDGKLHAPVATTRTRRLRRQALPGRRRRRRRPGRAVARSRHSPRTTSIVVPKARAGAAGDSVVACHGHIKGIAGTWAKERNRTRDPVPAAHL